MPHRTDVNTKGTTIILSNRKKTSPPISNDSAKCGKLHATINAAMIAAAGYYRYVHGFTGEMAMDAMPTAVWMPSGMA